MFDEVSFAEYNTGKSNWTKIPATMIRKVAICHALREAFPEDLGGLYGSEEMDQARDGTRTPRQAAPQGAYETPPQPESQSEPVCPIDAYKLALIRARDERGVAVQDAMAEVRKVIDKEPDQYDEADIAAAVTIVDSLPLPEEPEYEVVEEQLPLADDDIPF